jgi:hypothetical protein
MFVNARSSSLGAFLLIQAWIPLAAQDLTQQMVVEQCAILKKQVSELPPASEGGPNLILILGATSQEASRFHAENARYIFVSREPHTDPLPWHVRMDFNDLVQLYTLHAAVQGRVDAILPDRSVMKFTEWGVPHLKHLKAMLSPTGTLFIPVVTWGGYFLGLNPGGPVDPREITPPSGSREADVALLVELIQEGQAKAQARSKERFPPVFPPGLLVPMNWNQFDEATRAEALERWQATIHVPALQKQLIESVKFSSVTLVHFLPNFLKVPGAPDVKAYYLALKP